MKTKYLWRNLFREIAHTMMRFLSIFCISALGVSFFAGVRAAGPDMKLTADIYLDASNLADITAISTAGLTDDDIDALLEIPGVAQAEPVLSADAMLHYEGAAGGGDLNVHLISMPFAKRQEYPAGLALLPDYGIGEDGFQVSIPQVIEGRLPMDDHEIALDAQLMGTEGLSVGTKVSLSTDGGSTELYICGFVESPKYISNSERGRSTVGTGTSDAFAYASGNAIGKLGARMPMMAMFATRYTEVDITVEGAAALNSFTEEYDALIDDVMAHIEAYGETTDATWYVSSRTDNPGYLDYAENTERIAAIGDYFPLIFLLVAVLVALTTMTRMVEEQRIQMGTLKALGYSQRHIVMQYLMYAIFASLSGSIFGAVVGFWLFPYIIGTAYGIMYRLPNFQTPIWPDIGATSILAMVGCVVFAAMFACFSSLREVPASLMRPKAPKVGKRVFLEHIGFVWKQLSFTSKVTVRNLFRYKKRFFMSIVGIAGSCGLLVMGFGLSDSIFGIADEQFDRLWTMDIQAYTYDALPLSDLVQITETIGDGALYNTAYCYDKTASAGTEANTNTDVHLFVMHDPSVFTKTVHLSDDDGNPITMPDGGVVITKKLSNIYGLARGDTISIESADVTYEAVIAEVCENYVEHYVYFTPAYYEQVMGELPGYNCVFTNIVGYAELPDAQRDALGKTWASNFLADERYYTVVLLDDMFASIWDSLSILNYVVVVLIVAAGALAFVVMLNLTNINITERRRELATLRVLGFTDKEMFDYVFRENNSLAVLGTAVGLFLGKYLHRFLIVTCEVDSVMFVRKIDPVSYVYSAALSVGFALMVNLLMRGKVRNVDMVESLKSAE